MTLYERIHNTVEAEQWDGTPEGLERLARFAGDAIRGVTADRGPVLEFYCAQAETVVSLRVGGAVAAERDGSGFYPIAPDVLAAQFRPLDTSPTGITIGPGNTFGEPSRPAADDTLTDDELAEALDRLAWDQEG